MKIMSYNTSHCMDYPNRKIDFEATANVIKKYEADIVGLNEMRGEGPHLDYTAQTAYSRNSYKITHTGK